MISPEEIQELVEHLVGDDGIFVVDVRFKPSPLRQKVTVLIDTDEGISIDECGRVSRELAKILDERIEDAYTLEVSSPGIDTPLKFARQYLRNIGKSFKIVKTDGVEVKGTLESADENGCVILPEKKKKDKVNPEPIKLKFIEIKEAKVTVSFK